MSRIVAAWTLWLLSSCLAVAWAQDVQPVPPLSASVVDQTATLTALQLDSLQTRLSTLERDTGAQAVILMVPTTAPEDIAAYSQRVASQWRIGRAKVGDGLLIVVAKNDRKIRIEVSKALEGAIPDLAAKRIIGQAVAPAFKAGDFAGGLEQAVDQLAARIAQEGLPAPEQKPSGHRGWMVLVLLILVAALMMRRRRSGLHTSDSAMWLGGISGLGMGGRGGNSGGFQSGGGGDFGGGGASGDW